MGISITQLREFIAVAEVGSFSRAAEALFVGQPALSVQIKRLEADLGVALFERRPRGVTLTLEGAELLPLARTAVRDFDAVTLRAHALRDSTARTLVVGFMVHGAGDLMPSILSRFRARRPEASVQLRQFSFDDSLVGVRRGLSDIGFVHGPVDTGQDLQTRVLLREPVVAMVAGDHPMADRASVSIRELVREPFVNDTQPAGAWRDYWLAVAYRTADELPPRVVDRCTSPDEELEAVRMGLGVSICPESVRRYYPRPGVTFLDVPDMEPSPLQLTWRSDRQDDALVRDFVACAEEAVRS